MVFQYSPHNQSSASFEIVDENWFKMEIYFFSKSFFGIKMKSYNLVMKIINV